MANLITGIRILCALLLGGCTTFSHPFYVFYIIGGITDVCDGVAARHFGKETRFGAQFDTVADALFFAVVLIKTLRTVVLPLWLMIWVLCIAVLKCGSAVMGIVLYRRFAAEHTLLNKICGGILFAVPFSIGIFPWQAALAGMILTCCVATAAAVQEGYYIRIGKTVR